MVVTALIEEIKRLGGMSKPLLASIEIARMKKLYVGLFANSNKLPVVMITEDEPLPSNKQSDVLLQELQRWEEESILYDSNSDVYLMTSYEYKDGSYDFRYFKLKAIGNEENALILIAEPDEYIELREHYEAFDDNMLAEG